MYMTNNKSTIINIIIVEKVLKIRNVRDLIA